MFVFDGDEAVLVTIVFWGVVVVGGRGVIIGIGIGIVVVEEGELIFNVGDYLCGCF